LEFKYIKIQDELLVFLMANRDSSIISRKLGYKFNQVSRWQNHSKKLKWPEFIQFCRTVKIPIESVLEEVFGFSIKTKTDCNKTFLKILLSQKSKKQSVRTALHQSRATFYRLEKQKTNPDFILVLALIDLVPKRLNLFIETIKQHQNTLATKNKKNSPLSIPWLGVVSAAMAQKEHLSRASYSAEWIAKKVNLTVPQVQQAVQVMVENELIVWDGKHYGPTSPRTLVYNHKRSRTDFVNTFKFWTEKSLSSVENQNLKSFRSEKFAAVFRTFMATKENVEQINGLISELEEKIHNLITTTEGEKTEIRCFLMSHFDVTND
jgi:DNA-binding XRE family transcriptional regulator